jgi:hypothetical protein
MLFDLITTLILFGVLSRLNGRRRDDVLYYVSNTTAPRRRPIRPSAPRRGSVRSANPARKRVSFAGTP